MFFDTYSCIEAVDNSVLLAILKRQGYKPNERLLALAFGLHFQQSPILFFLWFLVF